MVIKLLEDTTNAYTEVTVSVKDEKIATEGVQYPRTVRVRRVERRTPHIAVTASEVERTTVSVASSTNEDVLRWVSL